MAFDATDRVLFCPAEWLVYRSLENSLSHAESWAVSLIENSNKPSPAMSDWTIESWQWKGAC